MSHASSSHQTAIIVRRSLFFLIMMLLTLGNLLVLFRGLNAPHAMDQAQIAREISRGNGFATKVIRPVAYGQAQAAGHRSVTLKDFADTYHSPLNPFLNAAIFKVIGADKPGAMAMGDKETVFPLDRVIVTVSTLFFLMAIGVNYLLISRIFDPKIAGICAILMLFCETLWGYSMSGLPQMLMLLLFSTAIYFVYRAVEATTDGKSAMMPALTAGVFFTLLALTHWMAVWIALGYIIYAAVAFRPRGIIGISVLLMLIAPAIMVMIRNQGITDSPFGTAFLTLFNGLGANSESAVMRISDVSSSSLVIDGIIGNTLRNTLLQATDIIPLLGGIIVAPLFFMALLHPFKRPAIANFRWAILLMWCFTAFGLAFFGISKDQLDPNQLHLLFAPIMSAYGLAFVSILWSRLNIVTTNPILRNVHYIVIIGICALPMILTLPLKTTIGLRFSGTGGIPQWPPYYAPVLASEKTGLKAWVSEKQITFADQPWAVAWYADRISVWLPTSRAGFEKIETIAASLETPVAGIVISPVSHGSAPFFQVAADYQDFASLVFDGKVLAMSGGLAVLERDPKIANVMKRFAYRQPLVGSEMIYYSDRPIRATDKEIAN